ncbi:Alpha/Beta hydrolase protein [Exophiala viscosa]|uniref:Alpha/Beta hydrolase protein n=1 Tax=Exophiala viscosa TaxID=2486360 RepID=A0AAN6IGU1_9EURO|nr:Alpha/Beta hydrolase protein [Exophiala viscosa]
MASVPVLSSQDSSLVMSPELPPTLSWTEKLDLVPAFLSIGWAASRALIEWPLRPGSRADTYYHHLVHAVVRQFSQRMSLTQAQWVDPSFISAYKKWCSNHHIPTNIAIISQYTKGYWLGDPQADYVMVYFHGGGFAFGGNDGHLLFWDVIIERLASRNVSLGVLFVAYPLMPQAVYPRQFQEAVNSIRYVLEAMKRPPGQIMVGGDSAGGNLAVAAMLHAARPSELAPPLPGVSMTEKLRALVLLSPWVSFDISLHSFERNRNKDYLQAETEKRWSDLYVGSQEPSPYNEPARASPSEWKDIPVQDILVTAGSNEVLLDGIEKWVKDLQAHNSNVTYKVANAEPHEAPLTWSIFGDHRETETQRNVLDWLKDHV